MKDELAQNNSNFISTTLAADLTGYSQGYIGELARNNNIKSVKAGRHWFVHRDQLFRYAEENKKSFYLSNLATDQQPESVSPTKQDAENNSSDSWENHNLDRHSSGRRWQKEQPTPRPQQKNNLPSVLTASVLAFAAVIILLAGFAAVEQTDSSVAFLKKQTTATTQQAAPGSFLKNQSLLSAAVGDMSDSASAAVRATAELGVSIVTPLERVFGSVLSFGWNSLAEIGDFIIADQNYLNPIPVTPTATDVTVNETEEETRNDKLPATSSASSANTTQPTHTFAQGGNGPRLSILETNDQTLALAVGKLTQLTMRALSSGGAGSVPENIDERFDDLRDLLYANDESVLDAADYDHPDDIELEDIDADGITTDKIDANEGSFGSIEIEGGFSSGATTSVAGEFQTTGDTIIGNEGSDDLTVNAGIASDLDPATTSSYSFGSSTNRFLSGYFADTLDTQNLIASSTETGDLTSQNATSSNLFASVANFTQAAIDTLTATFADFVNLRVDNATTTDLVAENSTTTNAYVENFEADDVAVGNIDTEKATTSQLFVEDDTTLGTDAGNTLVVDATVGSDLVPGSNATFDLGSQSFFWDTGFFDTINANNISAASSSISGTAAEDFTINSDNNSEDGEEMSLIFFRGQVTPNAVITWDNAADRFSFNQATEIWNESGSTTNPTLSLRSNPEQTADIFQAASSSGVVLTAIRSDGTIVAPTASTTNTQTTNLRAENATTTNATTTRSYIQNLFAENGTTTNQYAVDLRTENSTTTKAYIENLSAASSDFADLSADSGYFDDLGADGATFTAATSTNFFSVAANFTAAAIENLTATMGDFVNLEADNAEIDSATTTELASTDFTATGRANLASTTVSDLSVSENATGQKADNANEFVTLSQVSAGATTTDSFLQEGNSFGEPAVLGTNDNQPLTFKTNGTTGLSLTTAGNLLPSTDDAYNLGSSARRFQDLFLGPNSLNIGTTNISEVDIDALDNGSITLGSETTGAYDATPDTIADDGVIQDTEVNNDLTISSAGSVADGALSTSVSLLGQSISGAEIVDGSVDISTDTNLGAGNQLSLSGDTLNVLEGAGSGLDADLLDGETGGYYLDNTDTQNLSISGDTISLTSGGSVTINDAYNSQYDSDSEVEGALKNGTEYIRFDNIEFSEIPNEEFVMGVDDSEEPQYYHDGAWRRFWTDFNDGSGSGLSADNLDGLNSSQFLRSDTSDTMSGNLDVNGSLDASTLNTGLGDNELYDMNQNVQTSDNPTFSGMQLNIGEGLNFLSGDIGRGNDTRIIQIDDSNSPNSPDGSMMFTAGADNTQLLELFDNGVEVHTSNFIANSIDVSSNIYSGNQYEIDTGNDYCKYSVWGTGSSYCIGMVSGITYGALNDFAMTFTMEDQTDRGWVWRPEGASKGTAAMSLTTEGRLTVNTYVDVKGNVNQDAAINCDLEASSNGNIRCNGTSDRRLKEDITDLDSTEVLEEVNKLAAKSFRFKPEAKSGTDKEIGFIAQDVQRVFPELVGESQGYLFIDYSKITALLTESVQELDKRITKIEKDNQGGYWTDDVNLKAGKKTPTDNLIAAVGVVLEGFTQDVQARFKEVWADRVVAEEELCVGDTCVTESQLKDLLENQVSGNTEAESESGGRDTLDRRDEEEEAESADETENSNENETDLNEDSTTSSQQQTEETDEGESATTTDATPTNSSVEGSANTSENEVDENATSSEDGNTDEDMIISTSSSAS